MASIETPETRPIAVPGQMPLAEIPMIAWRRKGWILLVAALALGLGGVFLATAEPTYEVQARLLVQREGMPHEPVSETSRWDKEFLATQAEVVRSPAVVQRAVETHHLALPGVDAATTASAILAELRVAPVIGTNVLQVRLMHSDPRAAQHTIDSILSSYRQYLQEREQVTQSETMRWITSSEKELRSELERLEKEYLALREQSPLLGGQGREAASLQVAQLTELHKSVQELTNRRLELQNLLPLMEQASKSLDAGPPAARLVSFRPEDAPGEVAAADAIPADHSGLVPRFTHQTSLPPDVVATQQELAEARAAEQQLLANYGPRHPDVQAAREQVAAWEQRLREHIKGAPDALKQEIAALERHEQQLSDLYKAELTEAKDLDGHLIREQQALDGLNRVRALHTSLLVQLQESQLAEEAVANGRSRITVNVLEEPRVPESPIWPRPILVMGVAMALGLGAGLGLVLLLEARPATDEAPHDTEEAPA